MPLLFVYILKLSISLAVVHLFYQFVLRKLTFYTWNRWYLLGYSFLSFFIAFFNITPLFQSGLLNYNKAVQFVPSIDFYSGDISAGKSAEAVLVTITKNTTARQLEDIKKQMKDKGYELSFDKPTYNNDGILTHISGAIKSRDGQSDFSASDFEKLILAKVMFNYHTYLRIEIIDKKKPKRVI